MVVFDHELESFKLFYFKKTFTKLLHLSSSSQVTQQDSLNSLRFYYYYYYRYLPLLALLKMGLVTANLYLLARYY